MRLLHPGPDLLGGSVANCCHAFAAGWPSQETQDLTGQVRLTDDEIRERMSGNICRCSAYPQIVAAIRSVAGEGV